MVPKVPVVPVGFQNDLDYRQFQLGVASTNLGLPVSVSPLMRASPPNQATVSLRNDLQTGETSLSPSATAFKDGNIKYFDLKSFFFGCTGQLVANAADVAMGCSIAVTAYDIDGKMVGGAPFNFAPTSLTNAPMAKAVLPSQFVRLVNYTVGIATGTLTPALTVLGIDNVTHVNYW